MSSFIQEELEHARRRIASIPEWKREVLRQTRDAELARRVKLEGPQKTYGKLWIMKNLGGDGDRDDKGFGLTDDEYCGLSQAAELLALLEDAGL